MRRSSENMGRKIGNWALFLAFYAFCFVSLWENNLRFAPFCLSILVGCSCFFKSNCPHFTPKTPFFYPCFALFTQVFHRSKRFCLCNCSGCLCFCLAFSSILPCVLHHFALHLASKRTAFSTKTHCVLRHIARHLAAYCTTFCCKSPEIWCKWRFLEINIHFIVFTN